MTNNPFSSDPGRFSVPAFEGLKRIHASWGWFVAFGIITALLGVAALSTVVLSTVASVFLIGLFMIVAGGIEIGIGLKAKAGGWKAVWILVGFLYIVAGAFALAQPLLAAVMFTLMIGAALLATGILRIVAGLQTDHGPKALVVLAGAVTTLLGILILAGWPASGLVVLGTFLGIDLLFYGLTWMAFGLQLRNSARHLDGPR